MATERKALKFDLNTEAFQMRAQWKKQDNCRQQWFERWSWLLDERKETMAQADAIRQEASAVTRSQVTAKTVETKSLKPVPLTSTGVVGWLASRTEINAIQSVMYRGRAICVKGYCENNRLPGSAKPDCRLEIYTGWLTKPPLRLPDTWDHPNYMGPKK